MNLEPLRWPRAQTSVNCNCCHKHDARTLIPTSDNSGSTIAVCPNCDAR